MRGRPNNKPYPKTAGCPRKKIDWEKVKELCEAGCSGPEIASYIGVHPDTLYNRCQSENNMGYSDYSQIYRQKGDVNLRLAQSKLALSDLDRGMLIWLGKQRLKQKDKPEEDLNDMEKDLELLLKKIEIYKAKQEGK